MISDKNKCCKTDQYFGKTKLLTLMMSEPSEALMADANLAVKKDPFLPAKEFHNGTEFRNLLLEILNKQDESDNK